jgi:hypothetical protein
MKNSPLGSSPTPNTLWPQESIWINLVSGRPVAIIFTWTRTADHTDRSDVNELSGQVPLGAKNRAYARRISLAQLSKRPLQYDPANA